MMVDETEIPDGVPDMPQNIEDLDLPEGFLLDLTLKTIYTTGKMEGKEIAAELKIPFGNVIRPLLDQLEDEKYVEVKGGGQFADQWEFVVTETGRERVQEIFEEDRYIGPVPVSLEQYRNVTNDFSVTSERITRSDLERAYEDLIVPDETYDVIGPAVNSGKSVFVYGRPGNGKTILCERVIDAFNDYVPIPNAVYAGGSVINFYDPYYHDPEPVPDNTIDERWMITRRPFVSVGGELTMDELDLIYNPDVRFYEAPFQLKANTGILLIDDFGRQQMDPEDLLNRWIYPLEKGTDFLTLHTGLKIEVPFECLMFYSTNLNPNELVDEAFLRRLRYKLHTDNPSEEEYRKLFKMECKNMDLSFNPSVLDQFIRMQYHDTEREMRRCHPRDILQIIEDHGRFNGEVPELNIDVLNDAADSYAVASATVKVRSG